MNVQSGKYWWAQAERSATGEAYGIDNSLRIRVETAPAVVSCGARHERLAVAHGNAISAVDGGDDVRKLAQVRYRQVLTLPSTGSAAGLASSQPQSGH